MIDVNGNEYNSRDDIIYVNGNRVKEVLVNGISVYPVAEEIYIGTLPNKLLYNDGDTIDFTGLIVVAEDEDWWDYDTIRYPNGELPMNELSFSTTVINYQGQSGVAYVFW